MRRSGSIKDRGVLTHGIKITDVALQGREIVPEIETEATGVALQGREIIQKIETETTGVGAVTQTNTKGVETDHDPTTIQPIQNSNYFKQHTSNPIISITCHTT